MRYAVGPSLLGSSIVECYKLVRLFLNNCSQWSKRHVNHQCHYDFEGRNIVIETYLTLDLVLNIRVATEQCDCEK